MGDRTLDRNATMSSKRRLFPWHSFDVSTELPENWCTQIYKIAMADKKDKELRPTSVTSREDSRDLRLSVLTVGGISVRQHLPWLFSLYATRFLELGQSITPEPLLIAKDERYAINLNIQMGTGMRYECHVDSNPLEGILYVTTHPPGTGGELLVSNVGDVIGPNEVSKDATKIYPIAGQLIFFDGRYHSHYVEALRAEPAVRIAVTMNFYTPSCPEEARPPDLNEHLGIEQAQNTLA